MTEWFMVPVLKTGVVNSHREFESHSFRQISLPVIKIIFTHFTILDFIVK